MILSKPPETMLQFPTEPSQESRKRVEVWRVWRLKLQCFLLACAHRAAQLCTTSDRGKPPHRTPAPFTAESQVIRREVKVLGPFSVSFSGSLPSQVIQLHADVRTIRGASQNTEVHCTCKVHKVETKLNKDNQNYPCDNRVRLQVELIPVARLGLVKSDAKSAERAGKQSGPPAEGAAILEEILATLRFM
ncbi:hypothetical protein RRG08_046693 [Elysia crispata]|uniref:Uncharacterized protein n=1 Tax=Elysia crispata TaxID=231223 RepID=A0AAE1AAF3_9GAST|nr:hypothetical protein RRG08_046693 [Elysia crispata]